MCASNSKPLKPAITADLPMVEILARWPETIPVFLKYQMSCIGCYMSSFDTLEDALRVHNLPIAKIIASLNRQISEAEEMDQQHE